MFWSLPNKNAEWGTNKRENSALLPVLQLNQLENNF